MTRRSNRITGRLACLLIAAGLFCTATADTARAQVSERRIIDALTSPPATRSLSAPARPAQSEAQRSFIEGLRHRTRSLSGSEREEAAAIAAQRPSIDLEIYFDFDSAAITVQAEPQLAALGHALAGSELQGATVLLGGHTDARDTEVYNQGLSERRAEAVKHYLIEKFQLPAANLSTAGYGKRTLRNKDNPLAAENLRVQIVNLASAVEAER